MAYIKGMRVPIPHDGHKNPDGRVFQVKPAEPGERWPHKTLIGKVPIDDSDYKEEDYTTEAGILLMIPNDNYRREYKEEYAKYKEIYGIKDAMPPEAINVGLYLLVLGVAYKLGIYQLLCEIFPITLANAIMDLAMYYILRRHNTINTMANEMKQELMFSIRAQEDDWYTETFHKYAIEPTPGAVFGEDRVYELMRRWIQLRMKAGLEDTHLSLDGTNFDCQSIYNNEAQQGHAKSGKKINIVGVMAAVEAGGDSSGMPLAYTIDPGSKNDSTTAQDLLSFFTGMGLKIKCLLADRGFPYDEVLKLCDELGMPFLMMIKTNYEAFTTMYNEFKNIITWNEKYWIEGTNNIYGISKDGVHLFSENSQNPDRVVCVALFFDGTKASIKKAREKEKLNIELEGLRDKLKSFNKSGIIEKILICYDEEDGKEGHPEGSKITDLEKIFAALAEEKISVPNSFKDVIELRYDAEKRKVTANVLRDVLADKQETLGYSCMVSSIPKTAQEMSDEYRLRDYSEKTFSAMKTELGFRTMHTKGKESFHAKFFSCFIGDIIRNEIVCVFHRYEKKHHCSIDTNVMISAFSNICYTRNNEGFRYSGQASTVQKELLSSLGITPEAFKLLGPLVRARISEENLGTLRSTKREIPVVPKKRGPGRPKGSKNKPKDDTSKKNKSAKKESKKGKQGKVKAENASIADNTGNNHSVDNTNDTTGTGRDDQGKTTSDLSIISSDVQTLDSPESAVAEGNGLVLNGEQVAVERDNAETAEKSPDIIGDPVEDLMPTNMEDCSRTNDETHTCVAEEYICAGDTEKQLDKEPGKSKASNLPKTTRTGTQYKKTIIQDAKDRELSEKTGIDIIGNPPPRPWSRAFRAAETRRRNRLRKEAEKKWREICAAAEPEPDQ